MKYISQFMHLSPRFFAVFALMLASALPVAVDAAAKRSIPVNVQAQQQLQLDAAPRLLPATVTSGMYTTGRPTITGTAPGHAAVGFSISNGDKYYGSGTFPVVNGRWSHTLTEAIPDGRYTVHLYGTNNIEIARGTLIINARAQ